MFNPWPFGISYIAHFYYVKRLNSNSYQYQKTYASTTGGNSPNNLNFGFQNTSTMTGSNKIEEIHPDLVCQNDGEEKVLIDCVYRRASGFNKSKLGFFIMNPPNARCADTSTINICVGQLVITPKPGLFPIKR